MGGQLIASSYGLEPEQPPPSVAVIWILNVPTVAGTPDRIPDELNVTPAGNEPDEMTNEYGGLPPEALIVWLYGIPACPAPREEGTG
jgi:hypothetical protein